MSELSAEKRKKIANRWKYWDARLKKLWDAKITSGKKYGETFFQAQISDCLVRFADSGRYEDPFWAEANKTLNKRDYRIARSHQKMIVKNAKKVLSSL